MYKKFFAALCCMGIALSAQAQNGWLPPVYFNGSTNTCDGSPWKLVFTDDFNGSQLSVPWITFNTYNGMYSENDNWRMPEPEESIVIICTKTPMW